MKRLDFVVQTIILLYGIGLLVFTYGDSAWALTVLYIQLLMGPWQFSSSVISVISKSGFYKYKKIHLIVSSLYLIFLMLMITVNVLSPLVTTLLSTIPAWLLAIYYYIITCKWVFMKTNKRGRFLPHLSF